MRSSCKGIWVILCIVERAFISRLNRDHIDSHCISYFTKLRLPIFLRNTYFRVIFSHSLLLLNLRYFEYLKYNCNFVDK